MASLIWLAPRPVWLLKQFQSSLKGDKGKESNLEKKKTNRARQKGTCYINRYGGINTNILWHKAFCQKIQFITICKRSGLPLSDAAINERIIWLFVYVLGEKEG